MPHTNNPPIPEGPEAPAETGVHQQDTHDDQMRDMKIPSAGDQVTCGRLGGVKDLLAASHRARY